MDCAAVRGELRGLVRGHVAGTEEAALRRHLSDCDACRHEERAERHLDEALAERLPRPLAPAALRRRVADLLAEDGSTEGEASRPVRNRRMAWLASVAAAGLAVTGFVAGRAVQGPATAGDRLADELVTDHLRVLARAGPGDVESSDAHTVKPWFEGRLDFAPVVPGDRGELRLVGGSLGYVLERKAAVISYALRRHRVTLIAFPRAGLPGLERMTVTQPPVRLARRGFEVALWSAGDVGYALVADTGGEELRQLAASMAVDTRR
jgi:anti-sigma factor RsiW